MINISKNLIEAITSSEPVNGLTHNFYRYPARFSHQFARSVISHFSKPDNCIIDPFMGGGTSVVEAIAMNRKAIGVDLNSLACFITIVKTTPLSENDRREILEWFKCVNSFRDINVKGPKDSVVNLPEYIWEFFGVYLSHIKQLRLSRQQRFVRCVLLKTGQWAIDCRYRLPAIQEIEHKLYNNIHEMFQGLNEFMAACRNIGLLKKNITKRRKIVCRSTVGLEGDHRVVKFEKPRLVLTSPPYPGVHVLYHRWQVNGRRETPAPYWLTALNDGHSEAFYSLGGRSQQGIERYFISITEAFRSIRNIIHPNAHVVQLVAFSHIKSQLPRYLYAMKDAGYRELQLYFGGEQSRVWRKVPNRKWYADLKGEHDSMKELLLIHKVI